MSSKQIKDYSTYPSMEKLMIGDFSLLVRKPGRPAVVHVEGPVVVTRKDVKK